MAANRGRPSAPGLPYRVLKRTADIVLSLVALTILAIPLAVVALVIRCDSLGPVFVSQRRIGLGGRPFRVIKLRTMYADADDVDAYLTPEQRSVWEAEHTVVDDPRVTRVGRFLRATSFDEVPQFLNVLLGRMSLVGPRPLLEEELHWYGDHVDELLSVKPGLTGLWQVTERNDATFASGRRQEITLTYVRQRSLRLDLWILIKTASSVLHRTGI